MDKDKKVNYKGKYVCKKLKEIRKVVAEKIGGEFDDTPCSYEGDCSGTCPKCDAELEALTSLLYKKIEEGVFSEEELVDLFGDVSFEDEKVDIPDVPSIPEPKAGLLTEEDFNESKESVSLWDKTLPGEIKLMGDVTYDAFEDKKPSRVLMGKVVREEDDILPSDENSVKGIVSAIVSLGINIDFNPAPVELPPDCVGGIQFIPPALPTKDSPMMKLSFDDFLSIMKDRRELLEYGEEKWGIENPLYLTDWGLLAVKEYLLLNKPRIISIDALNILSFSIMRRRMLNLCAKGLTENKLFNVDIDVFYTFLDVGIRDINDKIVYSREAYYLAAKYNEKFEASKRLTIKGRRQLKFYRNELRRSMLFGREGEFAL